MLVSECKAHIRDKAEFNRFGLDKFIHTIIENISNTTAPPSAPLISLALQLAAEVGVTKLNLADELMATLLEPHLDRFLASAAADASVHSALLQFLDSILLCSYNNSMEQTQEEQLKGVKIATDGRVVKLMLDTLTVPGASYHVVKLATGWLILLDTYS